MGEDERGCIRFNDRSTDGLSGHPGATDGRWQMEDHLTVASDTRTHRFHELQQLTGISKGTLTRQLRELEADGLIQRHVFGEVPPRVEYSLTDAGHSFLPILDQMAAWSEQHFHVK